MNNLNNIFNNQPSFTAQNNIGPAAANNFRDGNGTLQMGQPGVGSNYMWTDGNKNLQFGPPSGLWTSK